MKEDVNFDRLVIVVIAITTLCLFLTKVVTLLELLNKEHTYFMPCSLSCTIEFMSN